MSDVDDLLARMDGFHGYEDETPSIASAIILIGEAAQVLRVEREARQEAERRLVEAPCVVDEHELLALLDARCSQDTGAWTAMLAKLDRHVNDFELIHKSRDALWELLASIEEAERWMS